MAESRMKAEYGDLFGVYLPVRPFKGTESRRWIWKIEKDCIGKQVAERTSNEEMYQGSSKSGVKLPNCSYSLYLDDVAT